MSFLTILLIAVGLAMDAFSVALGVGAALPHVTSRHIFRLSWHFGIFQFLMPVIGWAAGKTVSEFIAEWDHWVAFGLLSIIGARMALSPFLQKKDDNPTADSDPTRGVTLIALSVATSLDALAVGFSLAAIGVNVLYPAAIIGIVAGLLTMAGMRLGRLLGETFGRYVAVAGGLVLIAVGVKILLDHTT